MCGLSKKVACQDRLHCTKQVTVTMLNSDLWFPHGICCMNTEVYTVTVYVSCLHHVYGEVWDQPQDWPTPVLFVRWSYLWGGLVSETTKQWKCSFGTAGKWTLFWLHVMWSESCKARGHCNYCSLTVINGQNSYCASVFARWCRVVMLHIYHVYSSHKLSFISVIRRTL